MLMYRAGLLIALLSLSTPDCQGGGDTPPADDACQACLDSGGTWQPEANECTTSCDIQDISCYTTSCPQGCSDDCSGCFSQSDCEAAGCVWHQEAEAMWCTDT